MHIYLLTVRYTISYTDTSLLLNKTPSTPCLILATLVKPSPRELVLAHLPYPNFSPNNVLSSQSCWGSSLKAFPYQYPTCSTSYHLWQS